MAPTLYSTSPHPQFRRWASYPHPLYSTSPHPQFGRWASCPHPSTLPRPTLNLAGGPAAVPRDLVDGDGVRPADDRVDQAAGRGALHRRQRL
eukprot:7015368-Prymnesium_polylepis.1